MVLQRARTASALQEKPLEGSERDVVVGANRGGGRRVVRLVVGCVLWSAEELDGVGDDLDGLALGAVLALPLAPVQVSVDGDPPAFGQSWLSTSVPLAA